MRPEFHAHPTVTRSLLPARLLAVASAVLICGAATVDAVTAGPETAPPAPAAARSAPAGGGSMASLTTLSDEELARRVDAIRDEMSAHFLVEGVLSWYTRTQGEESIIAETYKGHERLYSRESVETVAEALRRLGKSPRDDEEARALDFLYTSLALSVVGRETAPFDDEEANAETSATVRLPWIEEEVAYRDLDAMLSAEEDAGRRAVILGKVGEVYRDVLNPIIERKELRAQEVVRELGFPSYIDLSQRFRWLDLKSLIAQIDVFYKATDELYGKLLDEEAREALGVPGAKMRRADIGRLARAPHLEKFLPQELVIPAFEEFLRGIGLDLTTAAGTQIDIDDAPNPKKEPRAACFPLRVPRDIRITVKPSGGLDDFHTMFHEGGHALHFGWTTSPHWEFQQLGNSWSTEGWAEFFSHSWDDPSWLIRYRDFVRRWNEDHPGANVPLMTDEDIRLTVRHRVFWNIYFVRRYGHAKLIYESVLHGGDPSLWRDVYGGQTKDLQELYRTVFQDAYGFPMTSQDALRFRTDVDDFFYAADYTRAYLLADMMQEAMRWKFGEDWFGNPEVGRWLREVFWKDGTRLQGDEIVELAGLKAFDPKIAQARLERLLRWKGTEGANADGRVPKP